MCTLRWPMVKRPKSRLRLPLYTFLGWSGNLTGNLVIFAHPKIIRNWSSQSAEMTWLFIYTRDNKVNFFLETFNKLLNWICSDIFSLYYLPSIQHWTAIELVLLQAKFDHPNQCRSLVIQCINLHSKYSCTPGIQMQLSKMTRSSCLIITEMNKNSYQSIYCLIQVVKSALGLHIRLSSLMLVVIHFLTFAS